jgi:predicted flap endonuclease-1-like 5' DNA nuclease
VNGLTLLVLIALVVGVFVAYRVGQRSARRIVPPPPASLRPTPPAVPATTQTPPAAPPAGPTDDAIARERERLVLTQFAEAERLRAALATRDAELEWHRSLAGDRPRLHAALAEARSETARYRQLVVDIENDAPPPLLESPTAPDDLKLIVGVGPVLERMLQQLGISTFRQIARWTERDIDEFDARLAEFPGRIRRDAWVTQARALHQSKYGESALSRER